MPDKDLSTARSHHQRRNMGSGEVSEDSPDKAYEKFVHSIFTKELSSVAASVPVEIVHNAKIKGKSGHEHQIDVVIRLKLAGFDLLIFVECKHYGRKVEIEQVMALKGRMDDCAAHKGIVITTSGFQEGALKFARANGISLALMDGVKTDWSNALDGRIHSRGALVALKQKLERYLGQNGLRSAKTYFTDRRWRFRLSVLRLVLQYRLLGAPTCLAFKKLGAIVKFSDHDFVSEDDFCEPYSGHDRCCFVINDSLEIKEQAFLRFVVWEALLEQ